MSEVDSLCEWLLALSCRPTKASTVYCLYNLATGEALHTKHNYKYTNAFTYIQIHKYKYTKASTVHAALPLHWWNSALSSASATSVSTDML